MKGKIVLITGGSDGLGKTTALSLAKMGAKVVIVGRNETKTKNACEEINAQGKPGNCEWMLCELSSQNEIRKLASDFISKYPRLDVLINNAGMVAKDFQLTTEGIEVQFSVNHLSQFLLTNLLIPVLKASAPARIVNIASAGHYSGSIDFENLFLEKNYNSLRMYAQTKLCNVLFAYELSRRLSGFGITANALHPGMVNTKIGNKDGGFFNDIAWTLLKPIMVSRETGAETIVFLASSPEAEGKTGMYFQKCKAKRSKTISYNEAIAEKLWKVSEDLCGLGGKN